MVTFLISAIRMLPTDSVLLVIAIDIKNSVLTTWYFGNPPMGRRTKEGRS